MSAVLQKRVPMLQDCHARVPKTTTDTISSSCLDEMHQAVLKVFAVPIICSAGADCQQKCLGQLQCGSCPIDDNFVASMPQSGLPTSYTAVLQVPVG